MIAIVARLIHFAVGACVLGWALFVVPTFDFDRQVTNSAHVVLSGESLDRKQLELFRKHLISTSIKSLKPSSLFAVVVMGLQLAEFHQLGGESLLLADADLETVVTAALADAPTISFLWLTEYWLELKRIGAPDRKLLSMSYFTAPNEAWIAIKRSPFAIAEFDWSSSQLKLHATREFARLVQSGLHRSAAAILESTAPRTRLEIVQSLADLSEADRREFAKTLESINLDSSIIPGVAHQPVRLFERSH